MGREERHWRLCSSSDNETEVDGKSTALFMVLKCASTARWLCHAKANPQPISQWWLRHSVLRKESILTVVVRRSLSGIQRAKTLPCRCRCERGRRVSRQDWFGSTPATRTFFGFWFVGCAFAYFLIHMFSLTKRSWHINHWLRRRAHEKKTLLNKRFLAYAFERMCLCDHVGGELAIIWWWVKRATRVLNVPWPCKYHPMIHCWQTQACGEFERGGGGKGQGWTLVC